MLRANNNRRKARIANLLPLPHFYIRICTPAIMHQDFSTFLPDRGLPFMRAYGPGHIGRRTALFLSCVVRSGSKYKTFACVSRIIVGVGWVFPCGAHNLLSKTIFDVLGILVSCFSPSPFSDDRNTALRYIHFRGGDKRIVKEIRKAPSAFHLCAIKTRGHAHVVSSVFTIMSYLNVL